MFYSHEILTNQQYGVATVWLVSTFGLRSSNRKISRKAIQEVNVRKACETILQPGAPIALRLQGSLLYGVSRVFSQQCSYVLTDAEKIHMHMRCFYNVLGGSGNALDPQAGKAKRNQLILPDDPDFEVNMGLPAFHFDEEGNLATQFQSQASRKTSSQFSPLDRFNLTPDGNGSFIIGLDLPQSSPTNPLYSQHSSYSLGPLSQHKPDDDMMQFGEPEANAEIFGDWGIEIDADGNVMATVDEPELPILPRPEEERAYATASGQVHDEPEFHFDDQDDLLINGGTAPPPEADEVPGLVPDQVEQAQENQVMAEAEEEQVIAEEEPVAEASAAPVRRRQRRRVVLAPDEDTKISRHELKSWSNDYLANAERTNNAARRAAATNPAAAKKHAYDLVFGRGVGGVGSFDDGLNSGNHRSHPLAALFAGVDFAAEVLDIDIDIDEGHEAGGRRGRRRSALEALELEEEDAERRVRRRLSDENEEEHHAQSQQNVAEPQAEAGRGLLTGEAEEDAEIGRRDGSALPDPDIPSDAPWNRAPSLVPGSSVKGDSHMPGSSRQVSASPLHSRGSHLAHLPPIDRFSDTGSYAPLLHSGGVPDFSSDPVMPPGEDEPELPHLPGGNHGSQLLRRSPSSEAGAATEVMAETSQVMKDALDRDGRNFLTYVNMVAKTRGETRSLGGGTPSQAVGDGDGNRRLRQWVAFDELLDEPRDRTRQVATQAFYNVLVLATKNAIKVEQDMEDFQPFGEIRVGVEVSEAEMLAMMEEDGDA
ncbi:hypothetical protein SMACR_02911 [Sordaria macrospora]|uniref:Uncharacterized protein n=2 Tax=Sordaria macrospora TaxID=5147 RepID=A0A8S8ZV34_SORMA|nr:putative REC8 protein [Sordaria macrospora k-hell]KAA8634674.1 hypothetical protein SMACR_02911 [Sordaria macrospora]KAH7634963.1 putative REC8 protein [Sordaria sp. MPI-SDFR-AT-0083]WPJ58268.1 hypothetical protein SMAC4_02911 [Sordaria macrospora]CCC10336.1 putative REC8 protein [Sordaria macrospora k-hell]